MPPQRVADALAAHPDASAVFLTEPSYVGVLSDVAAIAGRCRAAGVPLLVDGAWGAHLGFHPGLPQHALALGADALVLSTHKTLPAFTQSALLLARGESLDLRRLAEAFDLFNTTSPSGAIYASIDRARGLLEHDGVALLDRTLRQAERVRAALEGIEGIRLVRADAPAVHAHRPDEDRRLARRHGRRRLRGRGRRLRGRHPVRDGRPVAAGAAAARRRLRRVGRPAAGVPAGVDRAAPRHAPAAARLGRVHGRIPSPGMSPREAFFADHERLPDRAGDRPHLRRDRDAVPAGHPGAGAGRGRVSADVIEALRDEHAAGSRISYCSDPSLDTLVVVRR